MHDATFRAGVEVKGVTGQASCVGRYDGHQLETVLGHVHLDRATVLGQPVQNLDVRLEVLPKEPEALRLPALVARADAGNSASIYRL